MNVLMTVLLIPSVAAVVLTPSMCLQVDCWGGRPGGVSSWSRVMLMLMSVCCCPDIGESYSFTRSLALVLFLMFLGMKLRCHTEPTDVIFDL